MASEPIYFLQIWALWSAVGCIGYWLFHTIKSEESARSQLADAECRRESLQAQMVEARLSALQAQIEPHFLFNTLANVKRLYETAPARGREMLVEPDQLPAGGAADDARAGLDAGTRARTGALVPDDPADADGRPAGVLDRRAAGPRCSATCRRWCCPRWSKTRSSMACRRCPRAAASTSARPSTATGSLVIEIADNGAGFSGQRRQRRRPGEHPVAARGAVWNRGFARAGHGGAARGRLPPSRLPLQLQEARTP